MSAVLNSWKEIATYLDHGIRTVQRWEHKQRLPVHHVGSGKRAPVFAYAAEIEAWRLEQRLERVHISRDTALCSESRRLRGETQVLLLTMGNRVAEMRKTLKAARDLFEARHQVRDSTKNSVVT